MSKKFVNFDNDETISKYFKDVRKSVILSQEQEIELAKKIKNGDQKAIDALVKANLKFVVSIAKEYQGQGLPLSDLINEGNYGLIKAAYKFDHTKGFRFISYAVWWIRQSILQSLNDNARTVRLPTNVINKLTYLNKKIAQFETTNEREPVFGDILDDENNALPLLHYPKCASLNETVNEDGDELIDLIPFDEEESEILNDEKLKKELNNVLSNLCERERVIVEDYFGINRESKSMTLEAIGERYGLTKERIRQIKLKAIRKLRHNAYDLYQLIND
jgi:RNA polymerase primary sigma factor